MKQPIEEKCAGCLKIYRIGDGPELHCKSYDYPEAKWSAGKCPLFDDGKKIIREEQKKALDPIKASKRKMKGK
jgi:hypothetical protein